MTTCKMCNESKERIESGKSTNGTRKYYVDENGDSWMGRKCPDCAKKYNRKRMRLKRAVRLDLLEDVDSNT